MVNVIHRYFAGDKSLLDEIEANARSDHPMAQMARESLPSMNDNAAGSSLLGKRATGEEALSMDLIRVELKTNNDSVIAAVTTNSTKVMERMDKTDEKVEKTDQDVIYMKNAVATIIDHTKEVATLTEQMKAAEQKAKKNEDIASKANGEFGAKVARKYQRVYNRMREAENRNAVLVEQNADFLTEIQKTQENVEDVYFAQVETNASQDEIKAAMEEMKEHHFKVFVYFDEILCNHDQTNDNFKEIKAHLEQMKARQERMDARQEQMDARQEKILTFIEAMQHKA